MTTRERLLDDAYAVVLNGHIVHPDPAHKGCLVSAPEAASAVKARWPEARAARVRVYEVVADEETR